MKKVMLFVLICFFAASGIGLAKGPAGMGGTGGFTAPSGKWWRTPEVGKKLGLNKKEQQKLDELFIQNRRRLIDLKTNVQKEKLELEQILEQQNFDETACMDRFKKFQGARTNLCNERFKFLVKVRKLLGLDRYRQLKTEFRDRRMCRTKGEQGRMGPMKGSGSWECPR
ncbi:MAG: periplasmic heavy metal sensor [Desulfobacterales bacterium]|nr:periplasmic heavy metal sensor [Desulfobacterales bacterium]